MAPVEAIFAQTPGHDATELVLAYNGVEFARDESGRIPCPEQVVGRVEVVLTTGLLICHAVGEGRLPGPGDIRIGTAGAKGVLTGTRTVLGGGAAVAILRAAAC
jgi:hypothetical protein